MSRRLQELRSESGVISVGTVVGLALAAVLVYIGLAATNTDTDNFGSLPVPGTAAIELPKGETDVYYAEKASSGSEFAVPEGLAFGITGSSGPGIEIDARGAEPKETDDGNTQLVGAADIPADGIYTIEVAGSPSAGAVQPELTFGQSAFPAIADRAKDVGEKLIGPLGIMILVALVLLYYLPRIAQKNKKESGHYSEF